MTGTNIAAYARILTNTNSTTLSDADILTMLNVKYGHRILDILKIQVDKNANITESYTDLISTTGLVAGDVGYNGEYPFPTDFLRPTRVEILSTATGTPVKAEFYDIQENDFSETDSDSIGSVFSTASPYVRFERNSFFVRPLVTTTVTAGIHIWYEARQTALSTLADTPSFEANLHDILAFDVAELEALRHPAKYTIEWRDAFALLKLEAERRFMDFYKSQFKRNLSMRTKTLRFN